MTGDWWVLLPSACHRRSSVRPRPVDYAVDEITNPSLRVEKKG